MAQLKILSHLLWHQNMKKHKPFLNVSHPKTNGFTRLHPRWMNMYKIKRLERKLIGSSCHGIKTGVISDRCLRHNFQLSQLRGITGSRVASSFSTSCFLSSFFSSLASSTGSPSLLAHSLSISSHPSAQSGPKTSATRSCQLAHTLSISSRPTAPSWPTWSASRSRCHLAHSLSISSHPTAQSWPTWSTWLTVFT